MQCEDFILIHNRRTIGNQHFCYPGHLGVVRDHFLALLPSEKWGAHAPLPSGEDGGSKRKEAPNEGPRRRRGDVWMPCAREGRSPLGNSGRTPPSCLRVMKRRYVSLAWARFDTLPTPKPGGCNGGAQRAPLPRWFCSTKHILRSA